MTDYISRLTAPAPAWPRRLAIMGSTGSIGRNALRVVESQPDAFVVAALAAGRNLTLLAEQAARWRPPYLAIQSEADVDALRRLLPTGYGPVILSGPSGYERLAALDGKDGADMTLSAQSGAAGLRATVAAAAAGKIVCLANKESLVVAGALLRAVCARSGAVILPVDSEHGALFQCLAGRRPGDVARLILTASGGPFRGRSKDDLRRVTPGDALRHPNWSMGAKITIDSATLMNKGLEVIEACHLYGMPPDAVDVLVHPQSIVHSLAEFCDGSQLAQLAAPDMRLPIAATLFWPDMPKRPIIPLLDLAKAGTLTFEAPDNEAFPCLGLARDALATGRAVELNAANEVAVACFLAGDIGFLDIPALVADAVQAAPPRHDADPLPGGDVEAALLALEARDTSARRRAERWHA